MTPANGEAMFEAVFGHVSLALQEVVDDDADAFFVDPNDSVALYEGDVNCVTLEDLVDAVGQLEGRGSSDHSDLKLEEQQLRDEEEDVGFGQVDVFDVEELVGLANEATGKDDDILEELKYSSVAENSK